MFKNYIKSFSKDGWENKEYRFVRSKKGFDKHNERLIERLRRQLPQFTEYGSKIYWHKFDGAIFFSGNYNIMNGKENNIKISSVGCIASNDASYKYRFRESKIYEMYEILGPCRFVGDISTYERVAFVYDDNKWRYIKETPEDRKEIKKLEKLVEKEYKKYLAKGYIEEKNNE